MIAMDDRLHWSRARELAQAEVGISLHEQLFRHFSASGGNVSPIGAIDARLASDQA